MPASFMAADVGQIQTREAFDAVVGHVPEVLRQRVYLSLIRAGLE